MPFRTTFVGALTPARPAEACDDLQTF